MADRLFHVETNHGLVTGDGTPDTDYIRSLRFGHGNIGSKITNFLASSLENAGQFRVYSTLSTDTHISASIYHGDVALMDNSQTYGQIESKGGWLRTPASGILPDTNGGAALGTASWEFSNIYGRNIYTDKITCTSGDLDINGISGYKAYITSFQDVAMMIDTNNDDTTSKFRIQSNTSTYNEANDVFTVDQTGLISTDSTAKVTNLNVDRLDDLHATPAATRNNVANQITSTNASGYFEAGWINTTSGATTNTPSDVYVNTSDGYIRKQTRALFAKNMYSMGYIGSGSSTGQANNAYLRLADLTGINWSIVIDLSSTAASYKSHGTFTINCTDGLISCENFSIEESGTRQFTYFQIYETSASNYTISVRIARGADTVNTRVYQSNENKPTTITVPSSIVAWARTGTSKLSWTYPVFYRYSTASGWSGAGTMSSFNLTADSGTNQSITNGQTIDIAGGSGISTVVGATDTITITNDSPNIVQTTITGNAGSATVLQTARTINGVSFNGSANIVVEPYISSDDTGDTNNPLVFTATSTAGYKRLYEDSTLYFDNTSNILYTPSSTMSGTLSVRGAIDLADNDNLRFGSSDDYIIDFNGTNLVINENVGGNILFTNTSDATTVTIDPTTGDITTAGNLLPDTDNTGVVGNAANTWNNGQFTNMTITSTLSVRAAIDLADNDNLRFGSSDDYIIDFNASNLIINQNVGGDILITNTSDATKYTFDISAGTITATDFILSSDERLKKNIADLKIEKLDTNYKSFEFKDSDVGIKVGVIAQEIEKNYPELVHEDEEGFLSVSYNDLLIREVAYLKQENGIKEQKINDLEERLSRLEKIVFQKI